MIQFCGVYKAYSGDVPALIDIDVSIDAGEFVFVTGPSGAGKSTFLRMIYNAEQPSRGALYIRGISTQGLRPKQRSLLRRDMGVVFQDFKLLGGRNVRDNVAITLEVLGLPPDEIAERVYAMLKRVGLAHKMLHGVQRLAGGERQRVAIARALVGAPSLVLADEPTGNLDVERAQEIMALLAAAQQDGTTVVVATHDRTQIDGRAARLLPLHHGRLLGSVAERAQAC